GRCIATSAWETAEAMHASREQVTPIRDRCADYSCGVFGERSRRQVGVVCLKPCPTVCLTCPAYR
ncbi:hypothetical protein DSI94_18660, partial [Mycobacterium tuberculosis]